MMYSVMTYEAVIGDGACTTEDCDNLTGEFSVVAVITEELIEPEEPLAVPTIAVDDSWTVSTIVERIVE